MGRVLFRPFELQDQQRVLKIIARVMELSEDQVNELLSEVLREFRGRHSKPLQFFMNRFEAVKQHLVTDRVLTGNRRLLIGSYFTQEYSFESAALFNPSIVWHPDQSGLPAGTKRFILTLMATGEGHLSSICFRSGTIDVDCQIRLDPPTGYVTAPDVVPNA